jgi:predicted transglutaminase-like cysteine proteinase
MSDLVVRLSSPFGYFSRALRHDAACEIKRLTEVVTLQNIQLDQMQSIIDEQRSVLTKMRSAREAAIVALDEYWERPEKVEWSDAEPIPEEAEAGFA